jgi:hypothetical protein
VGGIGRIGRQVAVEQQLDQGPQGQAVVGADQVHRAAHHGDPHDLPVEQQARQLLGPEAGEPGPQADVRRLRVLALQAHQVLDGVEDRTGVPAQQHLAGQRRPVERSLAQHLAGLAWFGAVVGPSCGPDLALDFGLVGRRGGHAATILPR